jgi:uncharacterized delta-60 repeat protein
VRRVRRLLHSLALALIGLLLVRQQASAHDSGFGLARYGPDGVLDQSFGSRGLVVIRSAQRSFVANALALQPDGRIVIGGVISDITTGSVQLAVARYNTDGTPDEAFSIGGMATASIGTAGAQANALVLQPDGRILLAGTAFAHGATTDEFFVARLMPSGALDPSFGAGGFTTTRVGAGASAAQAVALEPDGRILVVGTAFSNGQTDDDFAVARYTTDGNLDARFGSEGIVTTDFSSDDTRTNPSLDRASTVALEPDGKIVVAGFTRGLHQSFAVARLLADGTLDPGFGTTGKAQVSATEPQVNALVLEASGDLVIAGSAGLAGRGTVPFVLIRLHRNGGPDETFGTGGLVSTTFEGSRSGARAVVAQADGKLVTGGAKFGAPSATGDAIPNSGFALARYNLDGSIDTGFGNAGRTLTDMGDAGATPLSLAVQPDGKILAAGLVFFQVPPPAPTGPLAVAQRLALPAAGLSLAIVALLVLGVMLRRRK